MKGNLLVILLMLSTLLASAQRFHGGIMAGGVLSQVQGESYGGFNKPGVYAGAFVNYDFGKIHTVQLEMDFIQKGSRDNNNPENGPYPNYILRVNYLEIPVLYQVHFFKRKFAFEIGPAFDVLLSSYQEYDGLETDFVPPCRSVTVNALAGVSFNIIPKLKVDFRFIMSINSIRQPGDTNDNYYKRFGTWGQFNDVLALTLWYSFK
jgi:hypothetical protein